MSIERQRAGRAVRGKLPAIREVDASICEDAETVMVLVELDDEGGTIASSFDIASITPKADEAVNGALYALLGAVRKWRAAEQAK